MALSLESLCQTRYLEYLEVECHNWVHLRRSSSVLLRNAVTHILPLLRRQLAAAMSGTSSTHLRSSMMREVLSGNFPTDRYRNTIRSFPSEAGPGATGTGDENVTYFINKIKGRTAKCTRMCCTGSFIVEAMLLVIMNDEIKELVFDPDSMRKAWKSDQMADFVPFNYPALIAAYKHYLVVDSPCNEQMENLRPVALEKIKIGRFDLLLSQHKSYRVLRSFAHTREYLQFMKYLGPSWSWDTNVWEPDHVIVSACDWPGDGKKHGYLPNSQHAMYALTDLFTPKWFRDANFEKLTEVTLSSDFVTNFCEQEGTPLFHAMGHAAPNLRVLDLSTLIRLKSESVLYLFFHDAFQTLHEYMYLHRYVHEVDAAKQYGSIYLEQADPRDVERHSFTRYCPWCMDPWAGNALRSGCEFNMMVFSVMDDRLWKFIEESTEYPVNLVKNGLMYSVSSRDLYKSATTPRMTLERPVGPTPTDEGFVPPEGMEDKVELDGLEPWYPPHQVKYVLDDDICTPVLNPVAQSLQILNMPGLSMKGEMIPFLMRACPKLKSLGHSGSVPYGLELLSDIQAAEGSDDLTLNLEEVEIDFDYLDPSEVKDVPEYDERYGTADTISTNSPNFSFLLANFGQNIFRPVSPADSSAEAAAKAFAIRVYQEALHYVPDLDLESRIEKYVRLLVRYTKKLKRLSLFLTSTFGRDLDEDTDVWRGLLGLDSLTELELRYARFEDVSSLVKTLGGRLRKLKTYCIPSRHGIAELMNWMMGGVNTEVQYALVLCESCPNLEELDCNSLVYNFHFGREMVCQEGHFARLRSLYVSYITWNTLLQIWSLAQSLEIFKLSGIVETTTLNSTLTVITLDRTKVVTLLSKNRMAKLNSMLANKLEFDSFLSAQHFLSCLRGLVSIGKITFRDDILGREEVDLTEDEWETWLKRRKEETGLNVTWSTKFLFQEGDDD